MAFSNQFALSLELSKVIPPTISTASKGLLQLVRSFQNSGSNIVTEHDLAEVFGRNFIEPHFASTFRTAVKVSVIHKLSHIELVLEAGAGPTVQRAVEDVSYFSTIVQLSLLLWPHELRDLALGMTKALEARAGKGGHDVPTVDSMVGTLRCIRQQTSGFMWELLFSAEEQRLDGLQITPSPDSRSIPVVILQGLMDGLTAIQRLPESHFLQVRTTYGVPTIVIWAHHLLGLTVEVASDHGVIKIGQGIARMSIHCTYAISREVPEIILLNNVKNVIFQAAADASDVHILQHQVRHPIQGWGFKWLEGSYSSSYRYDATFVRSHVLYIVYSAMKIAEERAAEYHRQGFIQTKNDLIPSKRKIMTVGSMLFPECIVLSGIDTTVSKDSVLHPDWRPDLLPAIFLQKHNEDTTLQVETAQMCCVILALSMVNNVQDCQRTPLSLKGPLRRPKQISPLPTVSEAFDILSFLLLDGSPPKPHRLDEASIVSSCGWSLLISSVVASEPGELRPGLTVLEGVPSKFGLRREWVSDSKFSLHMRPTDNESLVLNTLYDYHVAAKENDLLPKKGFLTLKGLKNYIGATETTFEVLKSFTFECADGNDILVLRSGLRMLQNADWRSSVVPSCTHDTNPDADVLVPEDVQMFRGLQKPKEINGDYGKITGLIHTCISDGDESVRWALLTAMTAWKHGYGAPAIRGVYIRQEGCCIQCAFAAARNNIIGEREHAALIL